MVRKIKNFFMLYVLVDEMELWKLVYATSAAVKGGPELKNCVPPELSNFRTRN